jgi:inner membrane transporter RhtA
MTALPLRQSPPAPVLPYVALVVGMLSLSIGTTFAKGLFPAVGAEGATAYRVGLAAILLLAVWRPWRLRFSRADLVGLALYGAAIGGLNLCFYLSLKTIPLGVAFAIEFAGPLSLALISSRKLIHFVWVGLAVLGLGLLLPLSGAGQALDPTGVALAAVAGVFWALYIVFGKRLSHIHPGPSVAMG